MTGSSLLLPLLRGAVAASLCGVFLAAQAQPGCLGGQALRGVNIAGGEFGHRNLPGQMHKDYAYPSEKDLRHFAQQGANTIRMPFRWERLQRTPGGPLDVGEMAEIDKVVGIARELHLCLILDAHNFGTYAGRPLGSPRLPLSMLEDFWLRMNKALPDADVVAFGLMNEPARMGRADWVRVSQEVVTALRGAGSEHLLLVSGAGWSGAHDWVRTHDGVSNAEALSSLSDPLRRSAIEVHQYADSNYSGTGRDCIDPLRMDMLMKQIGDWAMAHDQRLFLGEFGVPGTPQCLVTLRAQLEAMRGTSWAGWTYWAAGAWWEPDYPFSVQPQPGREREQLRVLREAWR